MKQDITVLVLVLALCYWALASFVFEWRNPKANRLSLVRDFVHVVKFEKMEKYQ